MFSFIDIKKEDYAPNLKLWSFHITAVIEEFLMHIKQFGVLILFNLFPWVTIRPVDSDIRVLHQHPSYKITRSISTLSI